MVKSGVADLATVLNCFLLENYFPDYFENYFSDYLENDFPYYLSVPHTKPVIGSIRVAASYV